MCAHTHTHQTGVLEDIVLKDRLTIWYGEKDREWTCLNGTRAHIHDLHEPYPWLAMPWIYAYLSLFMLACVIQSPII